MKLSSQEQLELFELPDGKKLSMQVLKNLLPDVETTLFFAKIYDLNAKQLAALLKKVHNSTVVEALTSGDHSVELQDYLVATVPQYVETEDVTFTGDYTPPDSELLVQLWKTAEVEVAQSIKDVAAKLTGTLHLLPSKEGSMVFRTMAMLNRNRPTIGAHKAVISHRAVPDVAVVLDVSGSMTSETVQAIIKDVVALSWNANAHMIIVSTNAYHWEPGTYDVDGVLQKAEYGWTKYETLAPLFNKDWGTVITIADYDSTAGAKDVLRQCTGRIGQVLDISLVNRPTFLGECLGQLAVETRPLLIAPTERVLGSRNYW